MSDIAKGAVIGVIVSILMLGLLIESAGIFFPRPPEQVPTPAVATTVRLGPEGKADSFFGEDLVNAPVPGSETYDFCFGELRVLRPSMMVSSMPDSYCTVTRGADGKWGVSTGGWQQCQVVCFNAGS